MAGFMGGGFGGANMMTPKQRRAAMAKEAAEKRKLLQHAQENHRLYGTQDPILINIQKRQAAAQQQSLQNQQMHNQQINQQAGNNLQRQQQQAQMQEYIHKMSQTHQGRQELARRGIRY